MRTFLQLVFVACLGVTGSSAASEMEEYRLKALFLYNFTQFIEWAPDTFKDSREPLTICVLGTNPFEKELAHALAGKMVDAHPLMWRLIPGASETYGCQIVFVTGATTKRARDLIIEHKQLGVLTVGEAPGFATCGGVVNFLLKDGRVKLEINLTAAERKHLRISAKLLKLAEIVK